jgi:hypothetical protein
VTTRRAAPQRRAIQSRQQRLRATQQQRLRRTGVQDRRQALRQGTGPAARRITAQQARQGRFAAARRIGGRRIEPPRRLPPRLAWRRGFYAYYVPWYGAVFWPYAYADLFFFTFWPYAYDDLYWAYAYDDFFDGIFFPYGPPYAAYAYAGPYDRVTTARRSSGRTALASVPGQVSEAVQRLCGEPGSGVTAWPIEEIEKAVKPTGDQHALLADLKRVSDEAADRFKKACPDYVPLTPTGRLAAMTERLQATLDAVKLVRPPLEKFYTSLDNEQQARFNAIGPSIGKKRQQARLDDDAKAECSSDKAGLTAMPIERIEETVDPTGEQSERLGKLRGAFENAVQTLEKACPDYIPQTPVGRLDVMQKRLEAMIEAANIMRPALDEFYGSLDNEQKARLNQLGRGSARTGG